MLPEEMVGECGYLLHCPRPVGLSTANSKPRYHGVGGAVYIQNLTHKTLTEKLRVRVCYIPLAVVGRATSVVACVGWVYGVVDPFCGYDLMAAESASIAVNHSQFYDIYGRYAQSTKCSHAEVSARVKSPSSRALCGRGQPVIFNKIVC